MEINDYRIFESLTALKRKIHILDEKLMGSGIEIQALSDAIENVDDTIFELFQIPAESWSFETKPDGETKDGDYSRDYLSDLLAECTEGERDLKDIYADFMEQVEALRNEGLIKHE